MTVADEVARFYVTPSFVAERYGVTRLEVHRAIRAGKLKATPVRGGKHWGWVLDERLLPPTFPR